MINDIVCHMRLRQNILVTFIDISKINFVLIFLSAQRPMTYLLSQILLPSSAQKGSKTSQAPRSSHKRAEYSSSRYVISDVE